jgi:arylsulfatase A-like enzyme
MYDSQLASLDRALGALFDALRRLDLYDRALVIVTADHGESLGEHGLVGHGQSLYDPELAIPLLVKMPYARHGTRRVERVQLTDLWPTIATALGLPLPAPLLRPPGDHPILAEFYTDPRAPADVVRGYQAAWYQGNDKLLMGERRPSQVFDLARDPAEQEPRPPTSPAMMAREAALGERRRTLEETLRARSTPLQPLDRDVARALEALGYIDGPGTGP